MYSVCNVSEEYGMSQDQFDKVMSGQITNMTKKEAALYLRCCEKHLENEVKAGRIRAARLGRRVLFRREELDRRLALSMALAA